MSVAAVSAIFRTPLVPALKVVALALADHADPYGEHIYPSVKTVAAMATLSERTVQRVLKHLLDEGIIEVEAPSCQHRATTYRIAKRIMQEARGDNLSPMKSSGVTNTGGQGCQNHASRGDTAMSPEPTTRTTTELKNPPIFPPKPLNGHKAQAERILAFLNLRAHRNYPATDTNLGFIIERLKEGTTERRAHAVISQRVDKWGEDDKMREYLRPATLFNRTKYNQYEGELPATAFRSIVEPMGDEA